MARKRVVRLSVHEAFIVFSISCQGRMDARGFRSRPLGSLVARGIVNVTDGAAYLSANVDGDTLMRAESIVERETRQIAILDVERDYSPEAIDAAWDSAAAE